jgi:hypothetical protein
LELLLLSVSAVASAAALKNQHWLDLFFFFLISLVDLIF